MSHSHKRFLMKGAYLGLLILNSFVPTSVVHASSAAPGQPPYPDILARSCTYLGSGLTGGPAMIRTDTHEDLTLEDVSLTFQCRPFDITSDPASAPETQKKFLTAVQNYADRLIYPHTAANIGKCRVIASQGSVNRLTTKPNDPQSYLYFNDDLLVHYHASFACLASAPRQSRSQP